MDEQHLNLEKILHEQFGYEQFRPGQKEIIEKILQSEDVLGVLPTGSGKSICYQLPSIILPYLTIVVSPLISLMIDQVRETKAFHIKEVVALHSMQTYEERNETLQQLDRYNIIYISPELIQNDYIIQALQRRKVSLFVIDEAHCISQWGYDFRPDYLRLNHVLTTLNNPPILALSGTITEEIEHDIIHELDRPEMHVIKHRTERENITLVVEHIGNSQTKNERLINIIEQYNVPTIIYFSSRKQSEEVAHLLMNTLKGIDVAYYHGGLDQTSRLKIQQQFLFNQLQIICATSAFGMGINKPNVRLIIHYHLPAQKESFIQEIGRAGRDGKPSMSIVLYEQGDEYIPQQLIDNELPTEKEIRHFFNYLYVLHKKKMRLDKSKDELVSTLNMNQTKIDFLQYQMENRGMIVNHHLRYDYEHWRVALEDIITYCQQRHRMKLAKFDRMYSYVNASTCLRIELYQDYEQVEKRTIKNCCSVCGYNDRMLAFGIVESNDTKKHIWQRELADLLGIGE